MRVAVGIPIIESVPGEAYQSHMQAVIETARFGRAINVIQMAKDAGMCIPWNQHEKPEDQLGILNSFNMYPHDRARSYITDAALRSECDLLFFIDSDMIIQPDAFPRLLKTMIERTAAVVSGWYYRRGWDYSPVWTNENPAGGYVRPWAPSGVHEIDSSGLGCALIDLHWMRANLEPPYYTMGCGQMGTEIHDDVSFYKKVKEKGGLILGDADVRCGHLGQKMVICDRTWNQFHKWEQETGIHDKETTSDVKI